MIIEVNENNISLAAEVHSISWRDSHKKFCTSNFIKIHDIKHQEEYIRCEIKNGSKFYMLIINKPVGIVSINNNLIENLYILPNEQRKGYGTRLLKFVLAKCNNIPTLWILDNNIKAYNLYTKYGFKKSGNVNYLSDTISEEEMIRG